MTNTPLIRWARAMRDGIFAPVAAWYRRQQTVEELSGLSDRVLADIGLTRAGIPDAVRQAYRSRLEETTAPTPTVTVNTVAGEARPAPSNDTAKHSLAA